MLVFARSIGQIPAMQTAVQRDFVTVEDYLAAEETSQVRHEYLGGDVFEKEGETKQHNQIVGNLICELHPLLKNRSEKLYAIDIRVNFHLRDDEYFYYPDMVVTCDKRDTHPRFIRYPKLIIEVHSESTGRVDKREKFFAYTSIESLEEYVLVAQDPREVTVFRRAKHWKAEQISGVRAALTLESLGVKLSLAAIYEGV